MLRRIPGVKIAGSRDGAARRPAIFVLLDDAEVEIRRAGTHNLDPIDSRFTREEAQGLCDALAELLKITPGVPAGAPGSDEGEGAEA